MKKSDSNDSQRISFAINYSTTTCCGCPYYRNSMDGVYCGKAEETGVYKGMIIKSSAEASRKIADKCPFKKTKLK